MSGQKIVRYIIREGNMKVERLVIGDILEPGDKVLREAWDRKEWLDVIRVTAKFAIVQWNEVVEKRFSIIIPDGEFRPCGKKDVWETTKYSAWRHID